MFCFIVIEKLIKLVEMKEGGKMKISNLINRKQDVFAQYLETLLIKKDQQTLRGCA